MKTIGYLWNEWCILYLEMALQSLCSREPSHPDIPGIILEISQRKEKRNA